MLISCYSLKIRFTRSIVLIQVGKKRLEVLQNKLKDHEPISKNRGKHKNRPRTIKPDIWTMANEHLSLIPSSKSRYAYNKTNRQYFQNTNLNQKKLYKLFCTYYKKKMKTNAVPMWSVSYRRFFQKQGSSFKKPRTDVCDLCVELYLKQKRYPRSREYQVKLSLHQHQVEKYKEIKARLLKNHKGDLSILMLRVRLWAAPTTSVLKHNEPIL